MAGLCALPLLAAASSRPLENSALGVPPVPPVPAVPCRGVALGGSPASLWVGTWTVGKLAERPLLEPPDRKPAPGVTVGLGTRHDVVSQVPSRVKLLACS